MPDNSARKTAPPPCNVQLNSASSNHVRLDGAYCFQIELTDILQLHKADLKMHDEIVHLINKYVSSGKIDPENTGLCSRKSFLAKVERDFSTKGLKPKHINVKL